jgi:pyruvate dehydrogenase E1 component alpha subunit/2-oxoisovalerate dehydrogenase E1 component alpha subunit
MISHLGSMISVVNGVLMAHRFQGRSGSVGAACIGDGGTSTGSFHEAINQAAVEKLPLVLVVTNNQYAYSTPNELQFACSDLADKALGYGIPSHSVDGTDLADCLMGIGRAVHAARSGLGPQFVVASSLRLVGHGEHDDGHYVSAELREAPVGQDCLKLAEERILSEGWADRSHVEAWHRDALRQVEESAAASLRELPPDPSLEDWTAISSRHLSEG